MDRNHPLAMITVKRLEQFLTGIANLQMDSQAVSAFMKRFAEFDWGNPGMRHLLRSSIDTSQGAPSVEDYTQRMLLPYLRAFFRAVWIEPDPRTRNWALIVLLSDVARDFEDSRGGYFSLVEGTVESFGKLYTLTLLPEPPDVLPVVGALAYLNKYHNRARTCPNEDCPAPFFLAKRHTQRYCSEVCAQNAEKESKRRWWTEHGSARRKKQARATTTESKARKKPSKKARKGK